MSAPPADERARSRTAAQMAASPARWRPRAARVIAAALLCLSSLPATAMLAGCGGSSGSHESEAGSEGASGAEAEEAAR